MVSTFSPNKNLELPAHGDDVDSWDVPVNADWTKIDTAFGGTTTINVVAASGTVALTSTQYTPPNIVFSGALTANVNYQLPTGVGGQWSFNNTTSGAFTVTISSAGGGTSYVLPQGFRTALLSDGTNIVQPSIPQQILGTNGYYVAPGGFIIQWGVASFSGTSTTVTYPIPFTSSVYSVVTNVQQSTTTASTFAVAYYSSSLVNFNLAANTSGFNVNWIAIGK